MEQIHREYFRGSHPQMVGHIVIETHLNDYCYLRARIVLLNLIDLRLDDDGAHN